MQPSVVECESACTGKDDDHEWLQSFCAPFVDGQPQRVCGSATCCTNNLLACHTLLSDLSGACRQQPTPCSAITQVHWPFTAYEEDGDGHKRGDLRHTRELTPTFKETWQAMEKLVDQVCSCTVMLSHRHT